MSTDLLRSEFRKVASVKLWWAMGLGPLAVGILATALSLAVFAAAPTPLPTSGDERVSLVGLNTAIAFLVIFAAVFGALNAAGEFRHRTMSTTFLTSSSRTGTLVAKLVVTAGVAVLYAVVVEIVVLPIVAAAGPGRVDGPVFGVLVMGVVVTVAWALIGAGLGLLLGNAAGAAIAVVVYLLPGEAIISSVLIAAGAEEVAGFLPEQATVSAVGSIANDTPTGSLPWWAATMALLGWTALVCTGAWWVNRTRDVG